MSVKANDLAIKALRPRAREYETAVREHRGLVVTIYPSGVRAYHLRYRQDGALKRVPLDVATLAEARARWEERRDDVRRGDDPKAQVVAKRAEKQLKRQEARTAPTVEELAADFIELYARRRKRSWRNDERMLKAEVIPEWGKIKAAAIARRDVVALLDKIASTRQVYANRVLAVTRKMFNWAIDRDVLAASPCARVKPPGKETTRARVLSDDELRKLWLQMPSSRLPAHIQSALKIQLLTATRIGEVAGAKWHEFDLKKEEWLIPGSRSKNGRENFVPLSSSAVGVIKTLYQESAFLFPARGKSGHLRIDVATHELAIALPRLKISHFTSHDLRRTAATKLAELGTPRVVIDAILNHKDRSVGAIYDRHDYAKEKRAALEAWASHLIGIVDQNQPTTVVSLRSRRGH